MTGAGKSVIIADLLAQIGHRFGFRLIVEEGLSHAVLTQTQGCEPVIINPNGNLTINYLDTCEAPLSPMHLAFSAGLCMLFCGNEGLDGERKAIRHALIVENLQQLYTDIFNDWIVANEEAASASTTITATDISCKSFIELLSIKTPVWPSGVIGTQRSLRQNVAVLGKNHLLREFVVVFHGLHDALHVRDF